MDKYKIITIALAVGLLVAVIAKNTLSGNKGLSCKDCNVIVIGVDTLRADHLSSLGYERKTTPVLDKLASEGTIFQQSISAAPWTVPGFMAIMTGTYPSVHGVINKFKVFTKETKKLSNLKEISPNIETLAEQFKKAGYATGGFTGDAGVSAKFGYNQGFDAYTDEVTFGGLENSNQHAMKWLDGLPKNQKFFMFFHGYDLHGQFAGIGKDYKGTFAPTNYTGPFKGTMEEEAKLREDQLVAPLAMTKEDAAFWTAWYDSKIHDADARLQGFLDELKARDLLDKTVIVVVSDHGEEFYEHKGFDHGHALYDELVHVPLIFKIPGVKGGSVVKGQVSMMDTGAAILKIAGITPSTQFSQQTAGRPSLLDYIADPLKPGYDVFTETDYRDFTHIRSIRTADGWKYIRTLQTGKEELYDLNTDPKELTNLAESNTAKKTELRAKLDTHIVNDLKADPLAKPAIGCLPVYNGECE
jgi:arylsulfatase A-like enzyme